MNFPTSAVRLGNRTFLPVEEGIVKSVARNFTERYWTKGITIIKEIVRISILSYLSKSLYYYLLIGIQLVPASVSPAPPPPPRGGAQHHIPNFATSAAKLVCRASRERCSTWPGLEPRPTSNSKLGAQF